MHASSQHSWCHCPKDLIRTLEILNRPHFLTQRKDNLITARGNFYYQLGQYQRAIADYTKAIQLDPDYAKAYHNRGAAYSGLSQYQNAINEYTKAIQLDPTHAKACRRSAIMGHI
jgi:tetratricopeptide (TPR) repeat protein